MTGQRVLTFRDAHSKAAALCTAAFDDASLALVRRTAARFASIRSPALRADRLFVFVRDGIRYVRDLGGEEFADAGVVLLRGFDDCDGKSRTLVALATAAEALAPVGLLARCVPVFPYPDVFSHVAAEFWWPGSSAHARANPAGWVRAETILAGVPLGAGTEAVSRDAAGRILYA